MREKLGNDIPCVDCGTKVNPVWFTDSVFWNIVTGEDKVKMLCPYCFIARAEKKYLITGWRLLPEFPWKEK